MTTHRAAPSPLDPVRAQIVGTRRFVVREMRTCPACGGARTRSLEMYCRRCERRFTAEALAVHAERGDAALPCGHPWGALVEIDGLCATCEGHGTITCEVPLDEALTALGIVRWADLVPDPTDKQEVSHDVD